MLQCLPAAIPDCGVILHDTRSNTRLSLPREPKDIRQKSLRALDLSDSPNGQRSVQVRNGVLWRVTGLEVSALRDRKSTRLNSSHSQISYAVFCLKKKKRLLLR